MLDIYTVINGKFAHVQLSCKEIKRIGTHRFPIELLDHAYEISITKNLLIVTTANPAFRNGAKWAPMMEESVPVNNINAYDWDGNHVWNIADILGDLKMFCYGGSVTTVDALRGHTQFDESLYAGTEGHELFSANAGCLSYIIDLDERKVIQKLLYK